MLQRFIFQPRTVKCFERTDFTLRWLYTSPACLRLHCKSNYNRTLLFRRRTCTFFISVFMQNRIFTRLTYGDEIKMELLVEHFVCIVVTISYYLLFMEYIVLRHFSSRKWVARLLYFCLFPSILLVI